MSTSSSRSTTASTRTRERSAYRDRHRAADAPTVAERLLRPRLMVVFAVLAAVMLLYGPMRTYYAARRDASAYMRQLAAIEQHNEELRQQVERLQTREGVEDEARRHGYVEPGETAVKVAGLPEEQPDISSIVGGATVDEQEVPWYLSVLDFVFSYEPVRTAG